MGLISIARFIIDHPLSQGRILANLGRFACWQIGARLARGPVATRFVNSAQLLASPGMTGATGNVYVGLHEFTDMSFVLHFLRPNDLFVDVGANIGSYTILATAAVGADAFPLNRILKPGSGFAKTSPSIVSRLWFKRGNRL